MCADGTGDSSASGSKIQIYQCGGDAAQQWTVESDGTIRINGKCLALVTPITGNGTKIQLWSCLAGDNNQQWHVQPQHTNSPNPGVELVNGTSGLCLEDYDTSASDNGTKNGTQLDLWNCNHEPQQDWTLPYRGPGTSDWLVSAYPSETSTPLCADDLGGSSASGNKIDIFECNPNPAAEDWLIATDGTVRIDGSCMDVTGRGTSDGTPIHLWSCNGGSNQQWRFLSDGSIMSLESGKCLDETSTATSRTQLEISSCHDQGATPPGPPNAAQAWMPFSYSSTIP